jgi:hypothetical protein
MGKIGIPTNPTAELAIASLGNVSNPFGDEKRIILSC